MHTIVFQKTSLSFSNIRGETHLGSRIPPGPQIRMRIPINWSYHWPMHLVLISNLLRFRDLIGLGSLVLDINDLSLLNLLGTERAKDSLRPEKKLKEKQEFRKVYINEDLTKATSELAFKARQLRRAGKLAETFTLDGKVFVKKFSAGSLTLIKNDGHLRQVADLSPYSEIAVRPLFNGPHLSQQTPGDLPSETRPQVDATSDPPQVTGATGHEGQSDMDINISASDLVIHAPLVSDDKTTSTPHESAGSHPSPNSVSETVDVNSQNSQDNESNLPDWTYCVLMKPFWWRKTRLTLALVMVCCPTAPSYYPNQRWSIMCKIHCHSSDSSFTGDTTVLNHQN